MPQTKWVNKDGLVVRFGAKDVVEENAVPAQARTAGQEQEVAFYITGTSLAVTGSTVPDERSAMLPAGATIQGVYLQVDEAFAVASSAAFALGTWTTAGTTNTGGADSDGLFTVATANVAAILDADLTPRVLPVAGSTPNASGALVGTRLSANFYVAASATTGSFTAGKARVVIRYSVPTV